MKAPLVCRLAVATGILILLIVPLMGEETRTTAEQIVWELSRIRVSSGERLVFEILDYVELLRGVAGDGLVERRRRADGMLNGYAVLIDLQRLIEQNTSHDDYVRYISRLEGLFDLMYGVYGRTVYPEPQPDYSSFEDTVLSELEQRKVDQLRALGLSDEYIRTLLLRQRAAEESRLAEEQRREEERRAAEEERRAEERRWAAIEQTVNSIMDFDPAEIVVPDSSRWRHSSFIDAITDERVTILTLTGQGTTNSYGDPVYLNLRRRGERSEVFVLWGEFLAVDKLIVTYRLDSSPAKSNQWDISTNYKSAFYAGDKDDLITALLATERLVVRLTPHGENPNTAIFDLKGLNEQIMSERHLHDWYTGYLRFQLLNGVDRSDLEEQ